MGLATLDTVAGLASQEELSAPGITWPTRLFRASASRLNAWLDCPRRYRMVYLDRPRPQARPQRAHTSVGVVTHGVLRDFWDLPAPQQTPQGVRELVESSWIEVGFRDAQQSSRWRARVVEQVVDYLRGIDRLSQPLGIERTVSFRSQTLAFTGRVDRLDRRADELVVVDYKTGRIVPDLGQVRSSLALGLYAKAVAAMWRRERVHVELHHLPTGTVVGHSHTPASIERKCAEAESIVLDLRRAEADFERHGCLSAAFPPTVSALCQWCEMRAHCPEGQLIGPEKSSWAGLVGEDE